MAKKNTISPYLDVGGNKNIGATIHIGQEIRCLPYAGFFLPCGFPYLESSGPRLIFFNQNTEKIGEKIYKKGLIQIFKTKIKFEEFLK